MKRWIIVLLCAALASFAALTGCATAQNEADHQSAKGIVIEKLDSDGAREFIMEDEEAVSAFFDTYLDFPEQYDVVSTEGLTEACSYVVWQDKTILAGETEPSGMERIMVYTLYEDSNAATMQFLPDRVSDDSWADDFLRVSCAIDADKASYLKEYDGV